MFENYDFFSPESGDSKVPAKVNTQYLVQCKNFYINTFSSKQYRNSILARRFGKIIPSLING
jgi:hypothetical protein